MKDTYYSEIEGMRDFYKEIGYENKVDFSCSTDGRLILPNDTYGTLNEFKLFHKSAQDVFYQMKRYCKSYNSKAKSIPRYGIYITLNDKKYQVFDLLKEIYEEAIASGIGSPLLSYNSPLDLKAKMENRLTQKGWIDENSLISYNDLYFQKKEHTKKKKDDFIKELKYPSALNIQPYFWNEAGEMERKFLDCIGSTALQKRLGAFFTPDYAAEKSTAYIRNIISNLNEDEDYIIVDRCAGTGNLEKLFTEEELSHCILNTIVYAERSTLDGVYKGRVKAILPEDETIDEEGCIIYGNALSESFNNNLKEKIEKIRAEVESKGKKLIVIGLENPPYSNAGGGLSDGKEKRKGNSDNFISNEMKKEKIGRATNELANKFIWSGFKYYFDYYVVYSPIKYWKSQHLIDKKFLNGIITNRKDYHATEGGIVIISWKNEDVHNEELQLENSLIKKVHNGYNTSVLPKTAENSDIILINNDGVLNAKSGFLINKYTSCHAKYIRLDNSNIKQALPLFAANCYDCKDYTEKEVIMKSGDGGTAYQNDEELLNDCFIWCCLTDKNKCISDENVTNHLCFDQNSKADDLLMEIEPNRYEELLSAWKNVLTLSIHTDNYNPDYKYGLYQIERDLNEKVIFKDEQNKVVKDKTGKPYLIYKYSELNDSIISLKQKLKEFYNTNIASKLFRYELLK